MIALITGLVIWAPWASKGPPPPTAVRAQSRTDTSVLVQWTPSTAEETSPGGLVVDHYLIQRNGVQAGSVPRSATSYQDNGLTALTTYRYSIVAVSGTNQGDPSDQLTVKTLAAGPSGLRASDATTDSVTLRWARPATGPAPDSYAVVRDGTEIGTVPGTVTSYLDKGLIPAATLRYTVVAVSGAVHSAPSSTLVAKTLLPSVADARVQGPWSVDIKVIKSGGGTIKVGDTEQVTWTLTPKCAAGPCALTLAGELWGHPFTMTLNRAGAVYKGTTRAHISHCTTSSSKKEIVDSLAVAITVKQATVENKAWAASSWVGTMNTSSPYTSVGGGWFCKAQSDTESLTASR